MSQDHDIRLRKALQAMQQMRVRLDSLEREKSEPIAIVGMACRFPGADDPQQYWELLRNGVDAIREVPVERWDLKTYYDPDPLASGKMYTRHGGFLRQVDGFDAEFFGIAPREAVAMDPQQRMLLEVSWEALEAAGQPVDALAGTPTGVYVGISTSDYAQFHVNSGETGRIDAYSGTGVALSVAAGRISYVFGLQGPNVAVDTFCSSSLVAIHIAARALRQQECNLALAGGVNLILSPAGTVYSCKVRALAPDGRCKTFDASADGYGRGEGCGMLVLKRLKDAVAAGDKILAVIRGSAINHDGRSSGLTAPNGLSQQAVIRAALADGGVDSADVSYVEAHGTGTPLGDPIEVRALAAAAAPKRTSADPLFVGSAKTNIGHLEAAAGVAGVMKVALALEHREIPPHLHLEQPNPHVPWDELPISIPRQRIDWQPASGRRLAGVSSFGFSGTNAHVILEEAPLKEESRREERSACLLPLSARTPEALNALVRSWQEMLAANDDSLHDLCYTASVRRSHHEYRLAIVANSKPDLAEKLTRASAEGAASRIEEVSFRFPAVWDDTIDWAPALGHEEPVFAAALERFQTMPDAHAMALLELWKSWGATPATNGSGTIVVDVLPSAARGQSIRERMLDGLAGLYVAGLAVEWSALYPDGGSVVSLPSYPWRRRRFWIDDASMTRPAAEPQGHPLLGRRVMSPALSQVVFESRLSPSAPAFLAGHRVQDAVLLPASGFVEMALAAAREVLGQAPAIESISLHAALALTEERPATVQTIVTPGENSFQIFSLQEGAWKLHASGKIAPAMPAPEHTALPSSLPNHIPASDYYAAAATIGLEYSGAFRAISDLSWNPQEVVAEIDAPALQGCELHPALFDACLQTLGARFLIDSNSAGQDPFLPVAIEGLQVFAAPAGRVRCHAMLHAASQPDVWEAGLRLFDSGGGLLAEAKRVICKRVARSMAASDRRYVVDWTARESNFADEQGEPGAWLLFADRSGVAESLAALLRRRGQECVLISPDTPSSADDIRQLLTDTTTRTGLPVRGVVHLWALDCKDTEQLCGSTLHAVQAVVRARFAEPPRFAIVTRGGQYLPQQADVSPLHSSLAGLGRIVKVEHPNLHPVVIDLDPAREDRVEARLIYEELMARDVEDQVAIRAGVRYVPRLHRQTATPARRAVISGDASYLITGGTGALGLQVAEWMVSRGARHLALVSRRAPSEAAARALEKMKARGAKVAVLQADVASVDDVAGVLNTIGESMPPLRGIVHAAAALDDGLLLQQTWERFRSVLAPKALGAWNLHTQTLGMTLDFFVLFSSATGLLGSTGQGSYAAGNAFLDGLAALRNARGLEAVSIAWGAWDGSGMAARVGERERRLWADQGIAALPPEDALRELGDLLCSPSPLVAVLAVEWAKFVRQYPTGGEAPVLSDLAREARLQARDDEGSADRARFLRKLEAANPAERIEILADHVRELVAAVLGYDPSAPLDPNQGFFEIGMDSLMAVDLQRRLQNSLGVTLSSTVGFDHPTVEALAKYLAEKALSFQKPLAKAAAAASAAGSELDGLDEEEILALFSEEFEKMDEGRPA